MLFVEIHFALTFVTLAEQVLAKSGLVADKFLFLLAAVGGLSAVIYRQSQASSRIVVNTLLGRTRTSMGKSVYSICGDLCANDYEALYATIQIPVELPLPHAQWVCELLFETGSGCDTCAGDAVKHTG